MKRNVQRTRDLRVDRIKLTMDNLSALIPEFKISGRSSGTQNSNCQHIRTSGDTGDILVNCNMDLTDAGVF